MVSPPKPFVVALVTYTVASEIAMVIASQDDASHKGTVAGGAVVGLATAAVLWFFAARGHRWPKWCLLVLVVLGIGGAVSFLDLRSFLATFDVAALIVLLRGWSIIEQQEQQRLGSR